MISSCPRVTERTHIFFHRAGYHFTRQRLLDPILSPARPSACFGDANRSVICCHGLMSCLGSPPLRWLCNSATTRVCWCSPRTAAAGSRVVLDSISCTHRGAYPMPDTNSPSAICLSVLIVSALVLSVTARAQERPPAAIEMAKTYGLILLAKSKNSATRGTSKFPE